MSGKRVMDRKKRRMPCELRVGSRVHSGLVLDLSPSGLFIQTNAKTRPGQAVDLSFSTDAGEALALRVEVVRKKVVPPRLLTLAQGGVGVRILSAPEAYYGFLRALGVDGRRGIEMPPERASAPEFAVAAPAEARFRVRIVQTSGPRSRSIDVAAPDADAARDRALEAVDDGWKVLAVEAL